MEPLPRTGARVVLRRLSLTDLEPFQVYRTDPETGRYQGWSVMSDEEAVAFLEQMRLEPFGVVGEWLQIGIADRATGGLIGDIGICVQAPDGLAAEIGFTLSPMWQGQGLAMEAVEAAISLLFEKTPISHILAITDARNTSSIRLLERLGMQRTETINTIFRGEPCIEHTYRLDRTAPTTETPSPLLSSPLQIP